MYETPVRSNSRMGDRRPPKIVAPSISATPQPIYSGQMTPQVKSSSSTFFPRNLRDIGSPQPSTNSSQKFPQTPQQKILLRKPMSMQTLSSSRSVSKLSTPRIGTQGEVYKGKIHVGVRAKPETNSVSPPLGSSASATSTSGKGSSTSAWYLDPQENSIEHETAGLFTFDKVYDHTAYNEHIFMESVAPLIDQVVQGYNATVFAYGTTGSGKTYTMQGSDSDPGVIPRSVDLLFAQLQGRGEVKLSYFEIYNERVYDLLSAEDKPNEVSIRDDSSGDTKVVGNREVYTANADDLLDWVASGDQIRRTSSTQYNEHSSRSHAVVRIQVINGDNSSVLYLCDLAGSERAVINNERRREGSFINKSLLTLSTVISILSQGGGSHVPYRDSKLTRLLQPSLSGTALVSMVCTIQTGQTINGGAETLNSVRFAAKAKNISVTVKRNNVFDDQNAMSAASVRWLEHLQHENDALRRENSKLKTEREDLQEKIDLLEATEEINAEASIEAMSGISFTEEGDDSILENRERNRRQSTNSQGHTPSSADSSAKDTHYTRKINQLQEELSRYKNENKILNDRVSFLRIELHDLDETVSKFASTSGVDTNDETRRLHEEIVELREQLRDKDMALKCFTDLQSDPLSERSRSFNSSSEYPTNQIDNLHVE